MGIGWRVVCYRLQGQNKALFGYAETSEQGLQFVEANAEELPFESASLDGYTIAFGIRNVTHIDRALSEAHRVRPLAFKALSLKPKPLSVNEIRGSGFSVTVLSSLSNLGFRNQTRV